MFFYPMGNSRFGFSYFLSVPTVLSQCASMSNARHDKPIMFVVIDIVQSYIQEKFSVISCSHESLHMFSKVLTLLTFNLHATEIHYFHGKSVHRNV